MCCVFTEGDLVVDSVIAVMQVLAVDVTLAVAPLEVLVEPLEVVLVTVIVGLAVVVDLGAKEVLAVTVLDVAVVVAEVDEVIIAVCCLLFYVFVLLILQS